MENYCQTLSTMKEFLLINSKLSINFWAQAIDVVKYLQTRLPTRRANKTVIVPKETWTGTKENVEYIYIFRR